jgi:hypothetical protein
MANVRIRWNGDQVTEDVKQAVGRSLFMGASHILNESNNIAPLDEGPLTQTSGVDVDVDNGQASIYYVQKYAVRVHEDPNITIHRGRQKKYLETTILNSNTRAQVRDAMAEEIRRSLGG